ncbi:hypothetical protein [Pseudomonas sp. IT-P74]
MTSIPIGLIVGMRGGAPFWRKSHRLPREKSAPSWFFLYFQQLELTKSNF